MKDNFILDTHILNICEGGYGYFFNKANVVGVALGYKTTKGICLYEKCITVFVSKKVPAIDLSTDNMIPTTYKNVKTDVVESGFFTLSSLRDRIRPAVSGVSIGSPTINSYGTMGCVVTDEEKYYILSCNHVMTINSSAPIGSPIIQPASIDKGNPETDKVAVLSRFIPLHFINPTLIPENLVDCALAEIIDTQLVNPQLAYLGPIKDVQAPYLLQPVVKIGRTTEITHGVITNIGATMLLHDKEGRGILFTNQIITTLMNDIGDSGALLLSNDNNALGLICGNSTNQTCCNSIHLVLSILNVKLVTG